MIGFYVYVMGLIFFDSGGVGGVGVLGIVFGYGFMLWGWFCCKVRGEIIFFLVYW